MFYFTDEKPEAQREEVTCMRLHSDFWGTRELTVEGGCCPGGPVAISMWVIVWQTVCEVTGKLLWESLWPERLLCLSVCLSDTHRHMRAHTHFLV